MIVPTINDLRLLVLRNEYPDVLDSIFKKAMRRKSPLLPDSLKKRGTIKAEIKDLTSFLDNRLASLVEGWVNGKAKKGEGDLSGCETFFLGLPEISANVPAIVRMVIDEIKPSCIAVSISPMQEFSANMFHSLSPYNFIGIPTNFNTVYADGNESSIYSTYYPGSIWETIIIEALQRDIPVVPVGYPKKRLRIGEQRSPGFLENKQRLEGISKRISEAVDSQGMDCKGFGAVHSFLAELSERYQKSYFADQETVREIVDKAVYCASRLADLSSVLGKGKILVAGNISYIYEAMRIYETLKRSVIPSVNDEGELYSKPSSEKSIYGLRFLPDTLSAAYQLYADKNISSTTAQKIFGNALKEWASKVRESSITNDNAASIMLDIIEMTRNHPDLLHGASVRASIAIKEVHDAILALTGKMERFTIERAAKVTLPSRVVRRPGSQKSEDEIIDEIIKAAVYGIKGEKIDDDDHRINYKKVPLSKEDVLNALEYLKDKALENEKSPGEINERDLFATGDLDDERIKELLDRYAEAAKTRHEGLERMLNDLVSRGYMSNMTPNSLKLTSKGISELRKNLENMRRKGLISEEELKKGIEELEKLQSDSTASKAPDGKLMELVADLMDVQHKFKSEDCSLEDAYVHYVVKENKGEDVDNDKLKYQNLHVLLYQLQNRGVVKIHDKGKINFTITGKSLDWLLDELIRKTNASGLLKDAFKQDRFSANIVDIRPYMRGDNFGDISVNHTLRKLLRNRKSLEQIDLKDLMSYLKLPTRTEDIVLCLDVSASMRKQAKLRFAKIAVTALARAAIDKNYRVGLVAFSNEAEQIFPLGKSYHGITDAVVKLRADQYTNIGKGIECARKMLIREKAPYEKHIVLITDGQPNAAPGIGNRVSSSAEMKREDVGHRFALVEARRTVMRDIKISILLISEPGNPGVDFAKKVANIGKGRFFRVSTAEKIPLSALRMMS
ncbi:MAG: VWA domain-containing protein [Candidatus Schekmanbacteria bacterium]|nr:VWA domain-containing protein [Candidatus Schekmanbacteria bacterium]